MTTASLRITPLLGSQRLRAHRLLERNARAMRSAWLAVLTGFFEPLFYLLSIGIGVGKLIPVIPLGHGHVLPYRDFVAPALMAASAMNGAIYDSTINVFFKLKYAKLYDAVLSTPMSVLDVAVGEISWALLRGLLYATSFLGIMALLGLVSSPWALLALPSATLIGFAFAAAGMAATTYMKSWQDFDYVQLVNLPLFLFSATFFPLGAYAPAIRWAVELTPLYHGVALIRGFTTGSVSMGMLGHAAYLLAMGLIGVVITRRRLARLLLT